MKFVWLLILCATVAAAADVRFQARRMLRDDVPPGKGQCDIRLQVDQEIEVSVRGDLVSAHTLSGRGARDEGSECNVPLPNSDIRNFRFDVIESRGEIRMVEEPGKRNHFAAIVRIRDTSDGEGLYHFRLSWSTADSNDRPPAGREHDLDRPPTGPGFSWNNTVNFKGDGRGRATINNVNDQMLREVSVEIDRSGKLAIWFKSEGRSHPLTFTGQLLSNEHGRWKVDVMSEDRRLRGPMWITVDARQHVESISLEATDGRDRMHLSWERR